MKRAGWGLDAAGNPVDRVGLMLAGVSLCGAAATGISAAVALSGATPGAEVLIAVGRGLMVAVPIAVGIWAWHHRPEERFGRLLVAVGFGWFLTTLAESGNSLLYSTGRVAGWVVEVGLVYLILAFPTGRLATATDRTLVWCSATLVAALYLPTALLASSFPLPSPYTSCRGSCPPNAFFLGWEPGVVDSVVSPLRAVLTALLFLAVTGWLAQRWQTASRLTRRMLSAVLAVAVVRCVGLAVALPTRVAVPGAAAPAWLSWMTALAVPALALAFLLGLFAWRLYCAKALQRLGRELRSHLAPADFQAELAEALGDPSLQLFLCVPGQDGRWVDARGAPSLGPAPGSAQRSTEVRDGERLVAVIVHDAVLAHDREFLDAVTSFALIALTNQQLAAQVASTREQVSQSRARIVSAADRERRRIERDLHDGAQQRLVALRVQLELTEELVREDPASGLRKLHGLGPEVDATLDEIRELAGGVYPSLLADSGVAEALTGVARKMAIPARVESDGVGRFSPEVESAVYFCCLEAMQNASKHAHGAHGVAILIQAGSRLTFEVRDDGAGFVVVAGNGNGNGGRGVTNMRDRIAAVDGELRITSTPGRGTVVAGSVPL